MSRKLLKNVFIFVIALFFIVYFYIQVKNIFIDAMETEYAVLTTFDDTVDLKCYIVRNETVISAEVSGTYNYIVGEGDKLSLGQTIAKVYSNASEYRNQEQINAIDDKIKILEDSSVEHNYFTLNVSKLDKDVSSIILEYRNRVLDGDYSLALQNKNELITTLNKRYLVVNALTGFEKELDALYSQRNALGPDDDGNGGGLTAPVSGYFFSEVDGYENILTPELLLNGSVDEIVSAVESEPEKISSDSVGKIVSEYDWYTVCVVDKEIALRFVSGTYYDISYPYSVGATVKSLLVTKVVQSDSNDVVLIFSSNFNVDSFNYMRNQIAQVKLDAHDGLRIKKEALRIVDGEEGVFILNGNKVEFKRASKIYENDGYYVISVKDPKADEYENPVKRLRPKYRYLEMFDAVINNGKDLYYGKTIG